MPKKKESKSEEKVVEKIEEVVEEVASTSKPAPEPVAVPPQKEVSPEESARLKREKAHAILVKKRDAGAVKRVGFVVNKPDNATVTASSQSCHFCGDTYTFQPGDTKIDDLPDPPERTGATKMDLVNHAIKAIKDLSLDWRWEE